MHAHSPDESLYVTIVRLRHAGADDVDAGYRESGIGAVGGWLPLPSPLAMRLPAAGRSC